MSLVSVIGLDPGSTSPGVAELQRNEYGWTVASMPKLDNDTTLAHWFNDRMRNPPPNLRLVVCEDVRNAVVWGKNGYGSGDMLESVGMARLFALFHAVPFVMLKTNTIRKLAVNNGAADKAYVKEFLSRYVRNWPKNCSHDSSDAAATALAGYRQLAAPPGTLK